MNKQYRELKEKRKIIFKFYFNDTAKFYPTLIAFPSFNNSDVEDYQPVVLTPFTELNMSLDLADFPFKSLGDQDILTMKIDSALRDLHYNPRGKNYNLIFIPTKEDFTIGSSIIKMITYKVYVEKLTGLKINKIETDNTNLTTNPSPPHNGQ